MMTYQETCEYLYNAMPMFERLGASGYKEGLENSRKLDNHFGNPHRDFLTIHIAGTNGKGSCSHTISAILQMCGYRVGLYTSPHLVDFSERIRINGQPTEMKVDIAVIEVGLGGRLDCTNIISPILSVITNIGYDHTQFLGSTLEEIALQKAGIIKHRTPVVIGETTPETRTVFDAIAEEAHAPIIYAEDHIEVLDWKPSENGITYQTEHFGIVEGELAGIYQAKNTNTILCVIRQLERLGYMHPVSCDPDTICQNKEVREGMKSVCDLTGLKGRWQTVCKQPLTICDTGHNVPGWKYLSEQLSTIKCHHMHILFGMVDDKDLEGVMALLPKDATYYFTKASTKRAVSENLLKLFAQQAGLQGECYPNVPSAYESIKKAANDNDFVFIGGSSYVVADFLKNCI